MFTKRFLSAVLLCLTLPLCGFQCTPVVRDIAKEELGVGILSVNLFDLYNLPQLSSATMDWRSRYARIGAWMGATRNFPDIVVLQETPGWYVCGGVRTLQDYGALDFLIEQIRQATGEQYRIAYLITGKEGGTQPGGWFGTQSAAGCRAQGGRALLYRSSRVRNVITAPRPGDIVATPYSPTYPFPVLYTPFMARSLQCCPSPGSAQNVCNLIDGALSAVDRSCASPEGLAWTRARVSSEGADPQKPQLEAVFSRFELVGQPGSYVHVYNVHRGFTKDPNDDRFVVAPGVFSIDQLVTTMEDRFRSAANLNLYPPIVVGDLNFGANNFPPLPAEVTGNFTRFEIAMWGPENVGALFGLASVFPAKQRAYANVQTVIPATMPGQACSRDPATLWSDHCGIYFRVEPTP